jgi:exonuclease III/ribonuclease HI
MPASMSRNDPGNDPDDTVPPLRNEGETGTDNWGEETSDDEIDEAVLRAEWLANDTTEAGRKTKASVQIATCNMKGRGETDHLNRPAANNKWLHINQILRERKIGILALQETHMTNELEGKIATLFEKRIFALHSRDPDAPNAKGVSIVINKELLNTENIAPIDIIAGRALAADIPWHNNERLMVLAIYAPNRPDQNRDFWDTVTEEWTNRRLRKPDLVLGDFNFVESFIDRLPAHEDRPDLVQAFDRFKSRMKLADGWRTLNPGARNYTYMQTQTEGQPQSRLDRIYVSGKVMRNSQEWDIMPTGGIATDHWMATVRVLSDNTPYQGPGRWSLPIYLLRDSTMRSKIRELAIKLETDIEKCRYRRTHEQNPQTLYKAFKIELAEAGRKRAKETAPSMKGKIQELVKERRKLANDNRLRPSEKKEAVINITDKINELEAARHMSTRTSTAAHDALEGERITKYWSAVNAPARRKDPIRNLRRPGGLGLESRSDLMAEIAREHHEKIQDDGLDIGQEERAEAIKTAHSKIRNKLTNPQKAKMAQRLKEDEVRGAIRAAKMGKAAGLDGIPAELWKDMAAEHSAAEGGEQQQKPKPPNIVKILTRVYNDIEEHGIEAETDFNEGWMCPIFKKNERSDIANYRPITVLNTDYKIMTKATTTKLTSVIGDIIDKDQAGFIPKRSIFDQVKLAKLVLGHAELTETNGAIVALDQEKAYDKIAHDYLWRTLIEFNMPQNFVNTVMRLYTNAHTSVMVNGILSQPFRITRGVRQGDPLSCLLFNMAIEPLACAIRQSHLKGLAVPGQTEKLIVKMFADDTTVYLDCTDDLNELYKILDDWCRASKAKFNITKTEVIPIGMPGYRNWVKETRKLHGTHDAVREHMKICRDGEPVRILGAWIGNGIDNAVPWEPVVEKIERSLDRWDKSHPSIEGRRLIIQMVAGGMTQYLTKVQEMPDKVTKRLTETIWDFIWNGNASNAPVNRETMHAQILDGGKKILDLNARNEAIQLTWLQTYMATEDRPTWTYFADALFRLATPASGRQVDEEAAINTFIQNWRPKTSSGTPLPRDLVAMVRTAEKHGLKMEGIAMGPELRRDMPLWFHLDESAYMRQMTNRKTARCLRETHKVRTTGQLEELMRKERDHVERQGCPCATCSAWRTTGCRNPAKCYKVGSQILASIPERWNLSRPTMNLDSIMTEDDRQANEQALGREEDVTFERKLTVNERQEAIRIFTKKEPKPYLEPSTLQRTTDPERIRTVWAMSKSKPDAQNGTKTAAAVWVERGDEINRSFLIGGPGASRQRGEIMAIADALRRTPHDQPLRILCQSSQAVENLTTKLKSLEDKGWMNVKHGDIFRSAASWAKKRRAKTYFKVARAAKQGRPESEIHEELDRCLQTGDVTVEKAREAEGYELEGARLHGLTQAEMYRHIVTRKNKGNTRRKTNEMIDRLKSDLMRTERGMPETEQIWKSIRHRDFSRAQRTFKWKATHGAYKVGAYWRNIPNYEQRATCPACGGEESIEHILLSCTLPSRLAIKKAELNLWKTRTGEPFPANNIGTRLGAGLIHFNGKNPKGKKGLERFWRIMQSETDQIIWTLRCEARIAREDRPEERHTVTEALNRWRAALERRLNLDRITADSKRFGKIATDRKIVLETWRGVVTSEATDDRWIEKGGVLVGRRHDQPGSTLDNG